MSAAVRDLLDASYRPSKTKEPWPTNRESPANCLKPYAPKCANLSAACHDLLDASCRPCSRTQEHLPQSEPRKLLERVFAEKCKFIYRCSGLAGCILQIESPEICPIFCGRKVQMCQPPVQDLLIASYRPPSKQRNIGLQIETLQTAGTCVRHKVQTCQPLFGTC